MALISRDVSLDKSAISVLNVENVIDESSDISFSISLFIFTISVDNVL